jgi:DNA (cytosine-5)-methyltransferase 1
MTAYYNEHDASAAAWLRELITQGHIAPGEVDERSIADVRPADLRGFTQCHFFAGVGVWSHALRGAGWADDAPVWTGSCPCQPFSASGKRGGTDDHRHLWPAWFRLIRECQPNVCFGEQVASPDGLAWFDFVSADLEGAGYAVGAADTCAAGVGAPHIRQRLYFVGERVDDATGARHHGALEGAEGEARHETRMRVFGAGSAPRGVAVTDPAGCGVDGAARLRCGPSGDDADGRGTASELADTDARGLGIDGRSTGERRAAQGLTYPNERGTAIDMADTERAGRRGRRASEAGVEPGAIERPERLRAARNVGDTDIAGSQGRRERGDRADELLVRPSGVALGLGNPDGPNESAEGVQRGGQFGRTTQDVGAGATAGFWSSADWIACRDGKARPVEPGTFPLVAGAPARVVRLRGYGNALCAPQAQAFIEAYLAI